MEPTADKKGKVVCHHCEEKIEGTIDQIKAKGWTWYSDDEKRYFWCKDCKTEESRQFLNHRRECREKR